MPDNVVICINESNKKIISNLYNICYTIDCSDNWQFNQKNIVNKTNICYDTNNKDIQYKYEYKGVFYESCVNGNLINNSTIDRCRCNLNYTDFYPKENDELNIDDIIYCYKEPKGYYLDKNDSMFKKCYYTCEECEIKGDIKIHNCLKCNSNYSYEIKKNNYSNCYEDCDYYHFFDYDYNHYCTINSSCPNDYPKLIENQSDCVKYNIKELIEELLKKEKNETQKGKKEEIDFYDSLLELIESSFTSEECDLSNLKEGNEEIIITEKMNITLTTSKNQKDNIDTNYNMTTIDLQHCETLLRSHYNVSNNSLIYIKKIDVIQEGMKIPKIEYDVYCQLSGSKLEKLNLSICENTKLSFSVPVIITENLDKLNMSSEYFNNICYKASSESGTDMLLKDRETDFIENNKTVCQEDCIFYDYNSNTFKANCSCYVKEKSSQSYADMNINKTKLYENFGDIDYPNSNLGITSCNVLSSTENIKSNTGFYLLLFILIIFIIVFIIFCIKGYNLLESQIDETIYNKFKDEKKNKKNELITESKTTRKKKTSSKTKKNKNMHNKQNNNSMNDFLNKKQNKNNNSKIISTTNGNNNDKHKKTKIPEVTNSKPDTDYEFNRLSYEEALRYDKRSSCEYYGSLLRCKQLFIFTFCSFNDYNSGILKKFMLFLSFALHYTVNALFFTDSNMHQIYEDGGDYNFGYQFPYIIISAIIATLALRLMLHFLVLTDKDILEVKLQNTKEKTIKMKKKKLKCMKIKFAIFFILNFILLGLFWYYLTCFNAIYENTQIYLIENTFISFGFSSVYPFVINIFPIIIRMSAIHSSKKDKEYIYKISLIVQLL